MAAVGKGPNFLQKNPPAEFSGYRPDILRDHPLFSAFLQEYREYARGGSKFSCTL